MAWVRTATSLISFGFAIYKFFQYLREQGQPVATGRPLGYRNFALIMIAIGLFSLLAATLEHRRNLRALSAHYGKMPRSLASILAALIAGLGILGLCAVILRQ
jgi:putative membrane protein